jgi:hypothetical protein
MGTFREAFRRVQPREFSVLVEHPRSAVHQLLVTGGATGASLGVVAAASLLFVLARTWRAQKHREERAPVLAGFGALLTSILHGLLDLNLSVPTVAAALACSLGSAWAYGTTH